jgi:hypothetical protein
MSFIKHNMIASATVVLSLVSLCFIVNAQSINITGSVVDDGTSAGIANAKVLLLEVPSCTTRTDANGNFALSLGSSATRPQVMPAVSVYQIALSGNRLSVNAPAKPAEIVVDVFTILGKQMFHTEKSISGDAVFSSLWKAPGLYYVKVQVGNEMHVLSSFGSNQSVTAPSLSNTTPNSLAKTAAAYTIEAGKSGYDSKQVSMSTITGSAGIIRLSTYSQVPGTWKEVTTDPVMKSGYTGVVSVVVDPVRKSDCWVGCATAGIWKSTDYGLTWKKCNTGTNADALNSGREWYFAIDPNPNRDPATSPTLYCVQGYGAGGIWKSTDGGVNWFNVWNNNIYAPDGVTNISTDVGSTLTQVTIASSTGPYHLIAVNYYNTGLNSGIFESMDGGGKWIVHRTPQFNLANHQDVPFVIDSSTWCVVHNAYPNYPVFRTTDCGATWTQTGMLGYNCESPLVMGSTVYIGSVTSGLFKSTDKGASWKTLRTDWNFVVVATATKLYVCNSPSAAGGGGQRLISASISNDAVWNAVPGASITSNGTPTSAVVTYDGTHYIILGAQAWNGVMRYVEP